MLKTIKIHNFKCFENVSIDLGKISLFSGTNSSGKSTAIQALLLLDNASANPNSQLNSEWLNLGTFEEARNFITRAESFSIEINSDTGETGRFTFSEGSKAGFPEMSFGFLQRKIFYLSAHRIGPQNSYNKNFNSVNIIGEKGEFLIDLLNKNKTFNVNRDRIIDNASYTLEYQVNFWLQKITQVKLEVEDLGISNLVAANYSFNGNTKKVRPYHIGAGISYLIGLIILGLFLEKDSVLIIENPEIHLHPKAQSDLADFLCFIANSGVQIIIESHSDHIFNGIRKSIFRETISSQDAKIHFFKMNENNLSINHLIRISDNGKILDYQEGLFDQFDNDLDELLGL
jgi:predicted ATPase